jgi:hypothetical protein
MFFYPLDLKVVEASVLAILPQASSLFGAYILAENIITSSLFATIWMSINCSQALSLLARRWWFLF